MFKYHNRETGKIEDVLPERWVWGALYRATPRQAAVALEREKERNKTLWLEKQEKEKKLREQKKPQSEIDALRTYYERKTAVPYPADQDMLYQFDTRDMTFHRVGEIEQDRLEMFSLYKAGVENKQRIDIPWQTGMRLIHKYRNIKPFYKDTVERIYMVGYKYNGEHSFIFVLPDDRIIYSPVDNIDLVKFAI